MFFYVTVFIYITVFIYNPGRTRGRQSEPRETRGRQGWGQPDLGRAKLIALGVCSPPPSLESLDRDIINN